MKNIYKVTVKITFITLILIVGLSVFVDIQQSPIFYEISKQTAEIGTLLLYLMLACKSLFFIFKKSNMSNESRLYSFLQENIKYQREQGLIVFNILFIHSYMATIESLSSFDTLVFNYFTVLIPTVILIYMEFTSFRYFQLKIKKWKKSHTIVWITLPLIVLHVILVSDSFLKYLFLTIILLILATIEIIVDIKKGKRHLSYLGIGIIVAIGQFSASKFYSNSQVIPMTVSTKNNISADDSSIESDIYSSVESDISSSVESDTSSSVESDTSSSVESEVASEVSSNVYQDGTFSGEGYGHHGRSIIVDTTIENDQIIDIEVVSQSEDDKWWQPVASTIPDAIISNNSTEGISYVAGSTHSSQGLIDAVDNSLENAKVTTENAAV